MSYVHLFCRNVKACVCVCARVIKEMYLSNISTISAQRSRTSDSLNERLPIKLPHRVSTKTIFFRGKGSWFSPRKAFTLDKYRLKIWVENSVSSIQHIGNRKRLQVLYPLSPPPDHSNHLAYSCSFT